jgi:hypothetical protein
MSTPGEIGEKHVLQIGLRVRWRRPREAQFPQYPLKPFAAVVTSERNSGLICPGTRRGPDDQKLGANIAVPVNDRLPAVRQPRTIRTVLVHPEWVLDLLIRRHGRI